MPSFVKGLIGNLCIAGIQSPANRQSWLVGPLEWPMFKRGVFAGISQKSGIGVVINSEETECVGECRDRLRRHRFVKRSLRSRFRFMASAPPQFVTVDMRELKAALLARAQADRVSVSSLVREAVAHRLGLTEQPGAAAPVGRAAAVGQVSTVKLSVRVLPSEAERFASAVRASGLSRGAYFAEMLGGNASVASGALRFEQLAALNAACGEISTLGRNIRHLAALLRQAKVDAAKSYGAMLGTLADDVRRNLALTSDVLADVRPRRTGRTRPATRRRHGSGDNA